MVNAIKTILYPNINENHAFLIKGSVQFQGKEYQIWTGDQHLASVKRLFILIGSATLIIASLGLLFLSSKARSFLSTSWQEIKQGKRPIKYYVDISSLPPELKKIHLTGCQVIHGDAKRVVEQALLASHRKGNDQALQQLDALLKKYPGDYLVLAKRANYYKMQGRLDLCMADLNCLLDKNPNNLFALATRGDIYFIQGKYSQALEDLNKVLSIDPNDEVALATRARIYGIQGKYLEALEDLNKALSIDPNDGFALAVRGDIYQMQGKYSEALEDLNKALSIDPNNTFALDIFKKIQLMQVECS